jgi:CheY-like chemotaxis protein
LLEDLPFELPALLHEVERMLSPAAQDKRLALELVIDPALPMHCRGDATRIRQVLVNLVSNAVKFTERGGVTLHAKRGGTEQAPLLRLMVDDTGPGMTAQARAKIFEPYVQEDASISRRHGGTGLGLAICRDLIELMRGRIEVQAAPGGGARFLVELPLHAADAGATVPADLAPAPGTVVNLPRVLLVEDNPVNLLVTEAMLRHLGAQVVSASSGEQALTCMAETHFDLVLMDLQMPGMDGLTAARRRRDDEARQGWRRQRMVALTGEGQGDARRACADAGMDGFLSKPVALAELMAALAAAGAASA